MGGATSSLRHASADSRRVVSLRFPHSDRVVLVEHPTLPRLLEIVAQNHAETELGDLAIAHQGTLLQSTADIDRCFQTLEASDTGRSRYIVEVVVVPAPPVEEHEEEPILEAQAASLFGAEYADEALPSDSPSPDVRPTSLTVAADDSQTQRDVVVVGGGPIGLWTALQLKAALGLKVLVLERSPTYQQRHVVHLEPSSLAERPKGRRVDGNGSTADDPLERLCASLPRVLRINDLEHRLAVAALELGVEIQTVEVTSLTDVVNRYRPRLVVGSDGGKSTVRRDMVRDGSFGLSTDVELDRLIYLKYNVYDSPSERKLTLPELSALRRLFPTSYTILEHIGKPVASPDRRRVRRVTVILAGLSQADFASVKSATFRKPFTLTHGFETMPPHLRATFLAWFEAKRTIVAEERVAESESIAAVALRAYRAHTFTSIMDYAADAASEHQHYGVALIGDAAFSAPRFRSLNTGLVCASALVKGLRDAWSSSEGFADALREFGCFLGVEASAAMERARKDSSLLRATRDAALSNLPSHRTIELAAVRAIRAAVQNVMGDEALSPLRPAAYAYAAEAD